LRATATTAKRDAAHGADQVLISMQTVTVPHEVVMKSLELFDKYVFPGFKYESEVYATEGRLRSAA